MPEMISAKQLRERLQDVVEKVKTRRAIYRSVSESPGFRHRTSRQSSA